MPNKLELKNVNYSYDGSKKVLKNINLSIQNNEFICIIGPNGCGKSTLLKSIAKLIDVTGNIYINNEEISAIKRKEISKKVSLLTQVSQTYFPYTVYQTVMLGRYPYFKGFLSTPSKTDIDIVNANLKKYNLYDIKDRLIDTLSGGQLQRAYLARTAAQNANILLLDEPTNHIDLEHQIDLLNDTLKYSKEPNNTVIAVLHDLNLVMNFATRVILINDGTILKDGTPQEVLNSKEANKIYNLDINKWMKNSMEKWK